MPEEELDKSEEKKEAMTDEKLKKLSQLKKKDFKEESKDSLQELL